MKSTLTNCKNKIFIPFAFLLAVVLLTPLCTILLLGTLNVRTDLLKNVSTTVLTTYVYLSFKLIFISLPIAFTVGTIPAWLTHYFKFFASNIVTILFLISLLFPSYILAGLYLDYFPLPFFESDVALACYLGIAGAPYIFIFVRVTLKRFPKIFDNVGASLGVPFFSRIKKIHFIILSPILALSASLLIAFNLGDIGTPLQVGVQTFSVGIYNLWFGFQDKYIALFLVLMLLFLIFFISIPFLLYFQRREFLLLSHVQTLAASPKNLIFSRGILLTILCILLALPGSLFPLWYVISAVIKIINRVNLASLWNDTLNSLLSAMLGIGLIWLVFFPFILIVSNKRQSKIFISLSKLSLINFAIPSLSFGIIFLFGCEVHGFLGDIFKAALTTRLALVIACSLKLLPFFLIPVADALNRYPQTLDETASSLGISPSVNLFKTKLWFLAPSLKIGTVLLFIEFMKELTMSTLLQPFGYSTLAMRIDKYASLQMMSHASVWLLLLIIICYRAILSLRSAIS